MLSWPLCQPSTPAKTLASPTHPTAPRLIGSSSWVLAANMQHSHTCARGFPYLWDLQIPAQIPCRSDNSPQTRVHYFLAGLAWSMPVNTHTHSTCTWLEEDTNTCPHQPPPGTWAVTGCPAPASVAESLTQASPFLPHWLTTKTPTGSSS